MNKVWKKVVVALFVFALVISGMNLISMSGNEVKAAETEESVKYYVQSYTGAEVSVYKNADTAPVPQKAEGNESYRDWLFAGWFTEEDCSTALGETVDSEATYYAKYVPAEVLSVKAQVKVNTTKNTDSTDLRLVSTVDSLHYKQVGFEVYYNGATKPMTVKSTTVYKNIEAGKDGVDYGFSPNIFDTQSEYFVTATLKNIANKNFANGFYIRPYWKTLDGTTVYGVSRYARVEDSYLNIVNVPVRLSADAAIATSGTVNVAYDTNKFTYAVSYTSTLKDGTETTTSGYANGSVFGSITVDGATAGTVAIGTATTDKQVNGEIAHLRFQVKDGVTLSKKNTFAVTSTDLVENVVLTDGLFDYFRLASSYNGTPDTSWYVAGETEFVLTTAEELYGLASLVNAKTFTTETVYIASDIVVNAGTPEGADGVWGTGDDDWSTVAPTHNWTPIGCYNNNSNAVAFSGVFDGQGHAIKGLYCKLKPTVRNYGVGFFGYVSESSELTNFRLEDSYVCSEFAGNEFLGSIAGYGNGIISKVYSNAFIEGNGSFVGGISGYAKNIVIKETWYDGQIVEKKTATWLGGLVGQITTSGEITSCLYSGSLSAGTAANVGGLVGQVPTTNVTITDSLVTGTVVTTNAARGLLVGFNYPSTILNTYAIKAEESTATTSFSSTGTKYSGIIASENDIKGYNAIEANATMSTDATTTEIIKLAFDSTWAMRQNDTPVLKSLVTENALYTPDTTLEQDKDGYYIISTPEELYGAAKLINEGGEYVSANFRLASNIKVNEGTASRWECEAPKYTWIPMGAYHQDGANGTLIRFAGNFDGAGYTISGIYCEAEPVAQRGTGLFGATATSSTIQNLSLKNSYFVHTTGANPMMGSVVGVGAGTIKKVYSNAIIDTAGAYTGGIVGATRITGNSITMEECWFDGKININAKVTGIGGIIGRPDVGGIIKHCYNSGDIRSDYAVESVGGIFGINTSTSGAVEVKDTLNTGTVVTATTTKVGSLIGYVDNAITLENVYSTTGTNSIGKSDIATYTTTLGMVDNITGYHAFLNTDLSVQEGGYWSVKENDVPKPKYFVTGNVLSYTGMEWYKETPYLLSNADDLYGFATLAQYTDFAGKTIKLEKDIIVNHATLDPDSDDWADVATTLRQWTPIGSNQGVKFAGTFDGDGHAISGLYYEIPNIKNLGAGLFGGTASGCVIQNLRLENSYFTQEVAEQVLVGGIVGYGQGTFKNIYSNVIIDTKGSYTSGFLGGNTGDVTIEDCWFDGELNVLVNGVESVGGFLGRTGTGSVSISHSLNSGLISSGNTNSGAMGGFIGYAVSGNKIELTDCLNVGTIYSEYSSTMRLATLIGSVYNATIENKITMTNTYAMAESYQVQANPGGYSSAYGANKKFIDYGKISQANLTGYAACENTELSFAGNDSHWVVINGSTPMLKNMATSNALYAPDTTFETDEDGYYLISSAEELYGAAKLINEAGTYLSAKFRLTNNIIVNAGDVSEWKNVAPKYTWLPMGSNTNPFAGEFDGNGYSIKGIYCKDIQQYSGLFGSTAATSVVENLKLEDSYFCWSTSGNAIMGSISGRGGGTFRNVYSDAIMDTKGSYTGGLLGGANADTVITDCWFAGKLNIQHSDVRGAGGFIGRTDKGAVTISHSLYSGYISNGNTSSSFIGGFIGYATNSGTSLDISDCLSAGTIHSTCSSTQRLATLIGNIDATIAGKTTLTNTYAMAESYQVQSNKDGYYSVCGSNTNTKEFGKISKADIIGENAYLNTQLTFIDDSATDVVNDGHWLARMNGTPVLKCFADLETDEIIIDTRWYTDAEEKEVSGVTYAPGTVQNPYAIENASELYGLARVVIAGADTFEGDTVVLSDDITVNEGMASAWASEEPDYNWNPIGYYKNNSNPRMFSGVLNGQGHTISGLYCEVANVRNHGVGLIGALGEGGRVTNLNLVNSYFKCTANTNAMLGSIAGYSKGNIDKVYSDAIMTSTGSIVGGLVAYNGGTIEINESWFAGSAETAGTAIGGIIGNAANSATIINCWHSGTVYSKYTGGGAYVGGLVGQVTAGNLVIQHSHVSGKVFAEKYHVGGLVGNIQGAASATITDSMFNGDLKASYDRKGDVYQHGQLVGTVVANSASTTAGKGPSLTVSNCYGVNDFATYDIGATYADSGVSYTPVVSGSGNVSVKADRLIGYAGNTAGLDYTNYWTLTKNGTPQLATFTSASDKYDGSQLTSLFKLDTVEKTLADAEDVGAGRYTVKLTGKALEDYNAYCEALDAGNFDAWGNDQSSDLNAEGVYNKVFTNADKWVVNVSFMEKTGVLTITVSSVDTLSKHLKASSITAYTAEDGYTTSGLTPTFSMVEQKYTEPASSYVIQLANGHFIVIDGGINNEAPYLMEYLESLVPAGKKPIIEAWVISHAHMDHMDVFRGFYSNLAKYQGKLYIEGIYFSEANDRIMSTVNAGEEDGHHHYLAYFKQVGSMFKTTTGAEPQVYRMYTGQRFTFDTVVMDVMLANEQFTWNDYVRAGNVTNPSVFNETSTWTMFTINGKKLLTAGDSNYIGKEFVVDNYSTDYLTVDIFTALHHGENINREQPSYSMKNDDFSKAITVKGAVFYSYPTDWYKETSKTTVKARIKEFMELQQDRGMTGFATTYESGSVSTDVKGYFYHGQGTVFLTFGDSITANVKAKNDWVNSYTE